MAATRITSREILDESIGNDDIAQNAGIDPSKLAVPDAAIIVGDANGQGSSVAMSGDGSLANDGTLTINDFAENQHGAVPGPDNTAVSNGYILRADGVWVPPQGAQVVENETPQPYSPPSQYYLTNVPLENSVRLFKNGVRQTPGSGNDYTMSGNIIIFEPGNEPQGGDVLLADYRF
jgi:hypothetical protein